MIVVGGRGSKSGELFIFVISVLFYGCFVWDGRIKRGDVLLNINGIDLINLSYSEVVVMLKVSVVFFVVVFKVFEVQIIEEVIQNIEEQLSIFSENEYDVSWFLLWVMWFGFLSIFYSCYDIVL